jgi:trigger factor
MQVIETKSEGLEREFKVTVAAAEIEEKLVGRLRELSHSARLPGFRPGKVPISVLRQRYGPALRAEALEAAVSETSTALVNERGLRPAGRPKIEITLADAESDLEYVMAFEVLPAIEPLDFKEIKLERLVADADPATTEQTLSRLATDFKTFRPIAEDRAAAPGDVAVIDFVGRIEGEEFAGGKAEGYELELGSSRFIPGFEEQLLGARAGEILQVEVVFPDTYGVASLAGKQATFEVAIKELREAQPTEIDDSLAGRLGFTDLAALRQTLAETDFQELKALSRLGVKRALLDRLAELYSFAVPKGMIDREYENIVNQLSAEPDDHAEHGDDHHHDDLHEHGDSHDHHDHHHPVGGGGEGDTAVAAETAGGEGEEAPADSRLTDEQRSEYREIAERRVRLGLILAEIARKNDLQVTREELHQAMLSHARRFPGQEKTVMAYLQKHPELTERFAGPILEEKVVDFLLEMGTVTEKKVSADVLRKAATEGDDQKASDSEETAGGSAPPPSQPTATSLKG